MTTTIFRNGIEKIMRLFYEHRSKFHLRDIGRKIKLNENSVSRFLKELENDNLLCSEKEGNLKKYSFVKSKNVFAIFTILDIEKFEKLSFIRKKAVNLFLQTLETPPIFALLFGSTAKGNFNLKSDIDILIISGRKIDTLKAGSEVESQTGLRVHCLQIAYKEFLFELKSKEDPVIQSALSSGYPLLNHIFYYEVIHNGKT